MGMQRPFHEDCVRNPRGTLRAWERVFLLFSFFAPTLCVPSFHKINISKKEEEMTISSIFQASAQMSTPPLGIVPRLLWSKWPCSPPEFPSSGTSHVLWFSCSEPFQGRRLAQYVVVLRNYYTIYIDRHAASVFCTNRLRTLSFRLISHIKYLELSNI